HMAVRGLGRFLIKGVKQPVRVFELLGPVSDFPKELRWLRDFDTALEKFAQRELVEAGRLMQNVLESRGGHDAPATFYLKQIALLQSQLHELPAWDAVIDLTPGTFPAPGSRP